MVVRAARRAVPGVLGRVRRFLDLNRGIPNYAIYLFSGIIVINLFSEAFKNATTSVVGNAPLVRKVYLPRQLFAVSAAIVALVHFLPQLALLLVVVPLPGLDRHISVLAVLAILAGMLIVTLSHSVSVCFSGR